jgi:hypothetical protein
MNARTFLTVARAALLVAWVILANCNLPIALTEAVATPQRPSQQSEATSTYLPLVTKAYSTPPAGQSLVQATDFTYLGAFRLPDGGERPLTFEYGGNAMTFNPEHGSLFITGHDRLAYGELPNGSQVAEISIPTAVNSRNLEDLPQAEFLQSFHNVLQGYFSGIDEIPRIGMAYYDHPLTGPKIHLAWGEYLSPDPPVPTHIWFDPDLSAPNVQGAWFLGNQPQERVNGYMLAIPAAWADTYTSGRYLGTGRFKDGGWSGMGPALFAYRPWQDDGSPPAPGTRLSETTLLLYKSSSESDVIDQCMANYQHPDEWEGGAWITTVSGKTAVLFSGTKSNGVKYWYGFLNPAGAQYPCVAGDFVGQFPVCRLADGTLCPPEDLVECTGHTSQRGWWSTHFDAELILYNPADLARVAQGQIQSWEPQPYATLDIDEHLYFQPAVWDADNVGNGDQRRYRIGDTAYDAANGLLYVEELYGEGAKPVVHVWRIEP